MACVKKYARLGYINALSLNWGDGTQVNTKGVHNIIEISRNMIIAHYKYFVHSCSIHPGIITQLIDTVKRDG